MEYKKVLEFTRELSVLYVEDDDSLREDTQEILEDYFDRLDLAVHGLDALEKYNSYYEDHGVYYDLIITDINMPFMDGETLIKELSQINSDQAIIVVSAHSESSKLISLIQNGITNFLLKPINPTQLINILYKTCKNIVSHKMVLKYQKELEDINKNLNARVELLANEIIMTQRLSVETIGNLIESYDDDTGSHVKRIENFTALILDKLPQTKELTSDYKKLIAFSSLLHDIGKLVIPKDILQKKGKLDHEEFEIIKSHSKVGGEILLKVNDDFREVFKKDSYFKIASDIAYYHHEKWDGSGYPKGLKGEEIPLSARIVSLVDVYDALRSKRPYKEGFSHQKALEIIQSERGKAFSPEIVDIFLDIHEEFDRVFSSITDKDIVEV